mmetsp:Transcript_19613/g.62931  ORF Transcript_19613/g.62931 Transcript_19613/m.62931 type:complete len:226 (+) Transcript_19613:344-1021(+)
MHARSILTATSVGAILWSLSRKTTAAATAWTRRASASTRKSPRLRTSIRSSLAAMSSTPGTFPQYPASTRQTELWMSCTSRSSRSTFTAPARSSPATTAAARSGTRPATRSTATRSPKWPCSRWTGPSQRSTRRTCATLPSSSSTTRPCSTTWTPSSFTCSANLMRKATTLWATFPRKSFLKKETTWPAFSRCHRTNAKATASSSLSSVTRSPRKKRRSEPRKSH